MKKYITPTLILNLTVIVGLILLFSSCAHAIPIEKTNDPYGFWGGLWHGMTLPFSFVGHLFDNSIVIYSPNNNGTWYDFGYTFGAGGIGFWIRLLGNNEKKK